MARIQELAGSRKGYLRHVIDGPPNSKRQLNKLQKIALDATITNTPN